MAGLNKAQLIGHLGADPEIRHSQDGRPIATFQVATSESWTDKGSGQKKERTEWHRVVVFSEGLAGIAEKYLKKGSKVYVEGQLQTRDWEDKDGVKRWTTEIVLRGWNSQLILCDRASGNRPPAEDGPRTGEGPQQSGPARGDMDDEIPF